MLQNKVPEIIVCPTAHLCIIRLLFRTVPAHARLTDKATIYIYRYRLVFPISHKYYENY